MNMVEKMAQASYEVRRQIRLSNGYYVPPWNVLTEQAHNREIEGALAALDALMEPTHEMCLAGFKAYMDNNSPEGDEAVIWRAMIRAAKEGG